MLWRGEYIKRKEEEQKHHSQGMDSAARAIRPATNASVVLGTMARRRQEREEKERARLEAEEKRKNKEIAAKK
eukprot:gene14708-17382_t